MNSQNNKLFRFIAFVSLFCLLSVLFLLYQSVFKNDKIAYVDSGKLLNDYKGAKMARKKFEKKAMEWQSNIDTLEIDVKRAIMEYEKEFSHMTSKEQKMSHELVNTKKGQLVNYQKVIRENAKQENAKLMKDVLSNVNNFLLDYGKKHGYKIIFIANESGTIAYAREGLDMTEDVVKELNEVYENN